MLILSRKPGETIRIGDQGDFAITILGVRGNQVRIGVAAPKEVPVHRQEVFERIHTDSEPRHG